MVRYYEWSCREWMTERATECARLRGTHTRAAAQCLDSLGRLKPEVVGIAIRALTKRAHLDALPLVGQSLEPSERRVLGELDTLRQLWANKQPIEKRTAAVPTHDVAAIVHERLDSLGAAGPAESKDEWTFTSDLREVTVVTYVELGGSQRELSYWQYLLAGSKRLLPYSISLLAWLGISSTRWRIRSEAEAVAAVDQVAGLAKYFIDHAPSLASGIAFDS